MRFPRSTHKFRSLRFGRKTRILLALLTLAIIVMSVRISAITASAAENSGKASSTGVEKQVLFTDDAVREKVVRVGYYENDTFQSGAGDDLVKSGYSYEYLQRLQMYTDWKYEYVYGEYGDLYDQLVNGEIDLLTGLAYREERTEIISYPTLAMGDTPYTFLKRTDDTSISADAASIAGKKIGVLEGAMKGIVDTYLASNQIEAEEVLFNDVKVRDQALIDGDVDITIVEGNGTGVMEGIEAFAEAGASDYFVVVNKQRPDLLEELNHAQSDLFQSNSKIKQELNDKWFRTTAVSTTLSVSERKWVEKNKRFTVGYYNHYLPYSDTDAEGNVTGIIKDVVPELFRSLKIENLELRYRGYDDSREMIQDLESGKIDAMFPALSEYWTAEQNQYMPTDPVINTYYNLVYQGEYPDLSTARFAQVEGHALQNSFQALHFPGTQVIYYDNTEDCLNAVVNGDADVMLVNGLRTDYHLRSSNKYRKLMAAQVAGQAPLGLAVLRNHADTVEILNHGISLLAPDYALTQTYQYEERHKVTVDEFLQEHIWIPLLMMVILVAGVAAVIAREFHKNRQMLDLKEEQHQQMQEKMHEITLLNENLQDKQAMLEESFQEQQDQIEEISALNEELEHSRDNLEAARDAAEAANNAKTTFLFNMSHDIRTPLNAIIGFTDLEEKNRQNPELIEEYHKKIKMASHQLLDILNNVLEMARIENRKIVIEEELTDANDFFETWTSVFEGELEKKNLTMEKSVDVAHRYLYLDRTHLSEILMNIVSNSIKYTNNGGHIYAGIRELPGEKDGECIIESTIRDDGIGMSEEFVSQIFDQFSRERNSTQNGIQGTGLGMAIVKSMVEMMHGSISVKSKVGEGTEVTIRLPHRYGSEAAYHQTTTCEIINPRDFRGKQLLMAEDNELNAEIAMDILTEVGLKVDWAHDGVEAVDMLSKAEAGYYDLVLMDVQMPNMNGYEATKRIRSMEDPLKAGIPILAMTANAFQEDRIQAEEAGMNGHIAKPLDVVKMFASIRDVLK